MTQKSAKRIKKEKYIRNLRKRGREKKPALLKRYPHQCFYCKVAKDPKDLTVDHLVPLSKGGRNRLENLRLACEPCNTLKDDMMPDQFRMMIHLRDMKAAKPLGISVGYTYRPQEQKSFWQKVKEWLK